MKKYNIMANIVMWVSLGLWTIKTLLDYSNYARHIELFATNGWFWYTNTLSWGKYIIPVIVICTVVKLISRKQ